MFIDIHVYDFGPKYENFNVLGLFQLKDIPFSLKLTIN